MNGSIKWSQSQIWSSLEGEYYKDYIMDVLSKVILDIISNFVLGIEWAHKKSFRICLYYALNLST